MSGEGTGRAVEDILGELAGVGRLIALTRERHRRAGSDAPTRLQRFALMRVDDDGTVSVSDLTEQFDIGPATMSQLLATLERRGWVTRTLDPADRRRHLVALTDAGRDIVEAERRRHRALLRLVLEELTPAERDCLLGIVQKIARLAVERPEVLRGEP